MRHESILLNLVFLLVRDHVYIADRFVDNWTKLRVFEPFEYDEVCYLDVEYNDKEINRCYI